MDPYSVIYNIAVFVNCIHTLKYESKFKKKRGTDPQTFICTCLRWIYRSQHLDEVSHIKTKLFNNEK